MIRKIIEKFNPKIVFKDFKRDDYLKIIVVVAMAAIGAMLFITISRELENEQVQNFVSQTANGRVALIKKSIEKNLFFINSTTRFYAGSTKVDHNKFYSYVYPLMEQTKGLYAIAWTPRITDEQRIEYENSVRLETFPSYEISTRSPQGKTIRMEKANEYYPVHFAEPFAANKEAMGFNLLSEKTRRKAILTARDTGKAIATSPLNLVHPYGHKGFLIFYPLYHEYEALDTIESRRKNIRGFVFGVFLIDKIIDDVTTSLNEQNIDISITYLAENPEETFYFYNSSTNNSISKSPEPPLQNTPHYTENIEFAGQKWKIHCWLKNSHLRNNWEIGGITGIGIGISTLVVMLYLAMLKRMVKNRKQNETLQSTMAQLQNLRYKNEITISAISDIFIALDSKNFVFQWNHAAETCFGVNAIDIIGSPLNTCQINWDSKIIKNNIEQCRANKTAIRINDVHFLRQDQSNGWLEISINVIDTSNGDGDVCLLLGRDITERKRREDLLQKLNHLQLELLGTSDLNAKLDQVTQAVVEIFQADFCRIWINEPGDLCTLSCVHATFVDGNPPACKNRQECLHLVSSAGRYTHIDGRGHRRVPFGAYKIGKISSNIERKFITNDVLNNPWVHNKKWAAELGLVSFAGYQLKTPGKKPIGVLALFSKQPITPVEDALLESLSNTVSQVIQLSRINKNMQDNEEKYRSVFETAANMILTIKSDGNILQCNNRITEILGYTPEELIGQSIEHIIHPDDYQKLLDSFQTILKEGSLYDQEYRMVKKASEEEESVINVSINSARFMDQQQNCLGIICIVHDTTQQKAMQSQLLQAQKLESIGQLASGIAHEINTPTQYIGDNIRFLEEGFNEIISLIQSCDSLYEETTTPAESHKMLAELHSKVQDTDLDFLTQEIPEAIKHSLEGVKTVAEIVKAMKEFSHPGQKTKKMLNVNDAIQNTLAISKNHWKFVADIKLYLEPQLPMISCYPAELNQVFLNLITNAADAIGETLDKNLTDKGMIIITTDVIADKWVEIRISDSGGGIPKHAQTKIFDPFFTTKTMGKGTGQGLSISHSIITHHDGTLTFETDHETGTTFIIKLPLTENGL